MGRGNVDNIIAASGIVYHQETMYNLEIFGVFQRGIPLPPYTVSQTFSPASSSVVERDVYLGLLRYAS